MIHASGYEYVVFLILFAYGVGSGLAGSVLSIPYRLKQTNVWVKNITDFFCVLAFFTLLFLAMNFHNFGQFRLFLAVAFFLGWLVWQKTLGKPFAKMVQVVYNVTKKNWNQFKQTKLGKTLFK